MSTVPQKRVINPLFLPASDLERVLDAARRAIPLVPKEARLQLATLLTPATLMVVCGIGAAWGASHWIGVGEVVDLVLLGAGAIAIGADLLRAGTHFQHFYDQARKASSEPELDAAAAHFARGMAIAGIDTVLILASRIPGARTSAAAVADAMKVEAEATIMFAPCKNGALWSALTTSEVAEARAASEGLVTLEAILKSKYGSFYSRLTSLNGVLEWELLKPVWSVISEKYARSLRGTVTVYVNLSKEESALARAAEAGSAMRPQSLMGKNIRASEEAAQMVKAGADREAAELAKNPIFMHELDVATDNLFAKNPLVDKIIVRDVVGQKGGFIIDRRYGTTH